MKYCTHCGKELLDEAVICMGCGCPTGPVRGSRFSFAPETNLLEKLSTRIMTNAIIWIVIAAIQLLVGVWGEWWFLLIVGALNMISAIQDVSYSKRVVNDPAGIVGKFEPVAGPIITLVYNLLIGGVIGVIGSIYYFVGIRNFVMENRSAFEQMDAI